MAHPPPDKRSRQRAWVTTIFSALAAMIIAGYMSFTFIKCAGGDVSVPESKPTEMMALLALVAAGIVAPGKGFASLISKLLLH